jgi:hypothetical protein
MGYSATCVAAETFPAAIDDHHDYDYDDDHVDSELFTITSQTLKAACTIVLARGYL